MCSALCRHGWQLLQASVLLVMAACTAQRPPLPPVTHDREAPPPPSLAAFAPSVVSTARISGEEAVVRAVNSMRSIPEGYRLSHPRYTVDFTNEGVAFQPKGVESPWQWRLLAVGDAAGTSSEVQDQPVKPIQRDALTVVYPRGPLEERYLARRGSIEQQFVIPRPLELGGQDLFIRGQVRSEGTFTAQEQGWLWQTGEHGVRLGNVRVYDARGAELTARMEVSADATTIVVAGAELATAAYPVTIDPEIGTDDFQLSDMGSGSSFYLYDAFAPAVAYNSTDNEYLVVWSGDDNTSPLVDGEFEIYGQRVDAATGVSIGVNDFRISDMGPDGNSNYDANTPEVAYNSTNNEYLVVWSGDDNTSPLVDNEFEILGQRLSATGEEIGGDFTISNLGTRGIVHNSGVQPAVTYSSAGNTYLVAWRGQITSSGEYEIYSELADGATL